MDVAWGSDIIKIVQVSLVPVKLEHELTGTIVEKGQTFLFSICRRNIK
jgi:hypothetical protein